VFKFAMLDILAQRAYGRATLDELQHEMEVSSEVKETAGRFSELDGLDVFQSGLVVPEGDGIRITDAGRSVLRALETLSKSHTESAVDDRPQSLKLIDGLIGAEHRLKIFDLGLRTAGESSDFEPLEDEGDGVLEAIQTEAEADPDDDPERSTTPEAPPDIHDLGPTGAIDLPVSAPPEPPTFLRRGFGADSEEPGPIASRKSKLSDSIASNLERFIGIWRGHLDQDVSIIRKDDRAGGIGGVVLAVLSLLVIIICAGAVVALTQIKSLKSEIATLQRELSPLKARIAGIDSRDKAKQDANQQKEFQIKSGVEKDRIGPDPRSDQAALNLTSEEVRLIRDFIKPAPVTGTPAPTINVGDTVSIGTIPLPSQLMEKVPKLLGARFTTHNGSIIILRRDSRQADVVLPPS
jgi:hypothetical protein